MIFILAANLEDARQWCAFNGVERRDSVYIGSKWSLEGRRIFESDRVVRTALHLMHPSSYEIERALERTLEHAGFTETVHGNLVARVA